MAHELTVGLVQVGNTIFGRRYLPYAVGLLQAYTQAHAPEPGRYRFLPPLYCRQTLAAMAEQLAEADIVGLSTYMWNMEISLALARTLKTAKPDVVIVLGGPQVPPEAEALLRQEPCIDVICHGEGEQVFLALLEGLPGRSWSHIDGISRLVDGRFEHRPKGPRLKTLDLIPSPYLSGVFEPLMNAQPEQGWLAAWETNRGCPFSCTFCDWGSAVAAKVYSFGMERLFEEIQWFADHHIEFVFCCDANFGILPRDQDLAAKMAEVHRKTGFPREISVQNTKNATERAYAVQALLSEVGLNKEVALSLQSVDEMTLKAIRRSNIALTHFEELQRRFVAQGVPTYTDIVLGLPGETYESFIKGVTRIIGSGQWGRIKFYNLTLLPGAEMARPDQRERYGIETTRTRLINIHTPMAEQQEVFEYQDVVVATKAMPRADWVRARAFAWMCEMVFFDKLLQLPMALLGTRGGIHYHDQVAALMAADDQTHPTVARIALFFANKARDIQGGASEHCESKRWAGTFWPANNYARIQLQVAGKLGIFYAEAVDILARLAVEEGDVGCGPMVRAAASLNRSLLPELSSAPPSEEALAPTD